MGGRARRVLRVLPAGFRPEIAGLSPQAEPAGLDLAGEM
jgi:hypothetical protein